MLINSELRFRQPNYLISQLPNVQSIDVHMASFFNFIEKNY